MQSIVTRSVYDKDHMSELWIENRSERDLRSYRDKDQKKFRGSNGIRTHEAPTKLYVSPGLFYKQDFRVTGFGTKFPGSSNSLLKGTGNTIDLWSIVSYKSSPENTLRLQRDSNPWPPRYRCVALPTMKLFRKQVRCEFNLYPLYEETWTHTWPVEHRTGIAEVQAGALLQSPHSPAARFAPLLNTSLSRYSSRQLSNMADSLLAISSWQRGRIHVHVDAFPT